MNNDPCTYIAEWLTKHEITLSPAGKLLEARKRRSDVIWTDLYRSYRKEITAHNDAEKLKANRMTNMLTIHSERVMSQSLQHMINEVMEKEHNRLMGVVACKGENLDLIRDYSQALTGKQSELTTMVLAHWCWMVKRKLMGLRVSQHIMPIYYGAQHSGKSVAIDRLTRPFANKTVHLSLDSIGDDRYGKSLNENVVCVCDELQGVNRVDLQGLKRTITASAVTYRLLGTNSVITVDQNVSFIGATNTPIDQLIRDSTGARRFFQLNVQPVINREIINSIDYFNLWTGIDENRENGYLSSVQTELNEAQKELTVKDPIEEFMDDQGFSPKGDRMVDVDMGAIYGDYQKWCMANGHKSPKTSNFFSSKLGQLGYERKRTNKARLITVHSETSKTTPKLESVSNNSIEDDLVFDEPFGNVQALKNWSKIVKNYNTK